MGLGYERFGAQVASEFYIMWTPWIVKSWDLGGLIFYM
jgi:hypothetical protein